VANPSRYKTCQLFRYFGHRKIWGVKIYFIEPRVPGGSARIGLSHQRFRKTHWDEQGGLVFSVVERKIGVAGVLLAGEP
jgi:hypothetical protein